MPEPILMRSCDISSNHNFSSAFVSARVSRPTLFAQLGCVTPTDTILKHFKLDSWNTDSNVMASTGAQCKWKRSSGNIDETTKVSVANHCLMNALHMFLGDTVPPLPLTQHKINSKYHLLITNVCLLFRI